MVTSQGLRGLMLRGVPSGANFPMRGPSTARIPRAKPPAIAWITPLA